METTLSIGGAILFGVFGLAPAVMRACVVYRERSPLPTSNADAASAHGGGRARLRHGPSPSGLSR